MLLTHKLHPPGGAALDLGALQLLAPQEELGPGALQTSGRTTMTIATTQYYYS